MTKAVIRYVGDLRCEAVHESGTTIVTDAPKDNHGKGEAFSPTDLLGTALATCILTTMAIVAQQKYGFDLGKATGTAEKIMTATAPRRIAELVVALKFALPGDHPNRADLERVIDRCPVHHALNPDIKITVTTEWGVAL